ncbi:MAG: ComEC/Rec2 family competence protein [Phycisphaerales bacterium]|nr:ComEC/Rec2 family competence protein [Phycisphaerales bacterium]
MKERFAPTGGDVGLVVGVGAVTGTVLASWTSESAFPLLAAGLALAVFGWLVCHSPSECVDRRRERLRRVVLVGIATAALFMFRARSNFEDPSAGFEFPAPSARLVTVEGRLLETPRAIAGGVRRVRPGVGDQSTTARFEVHRVSTDPSSSGSVSSGVVVSVRFDRGGALVVPGVLIRLRARLESRVTMTNPGERSPPLHPSHDTSVVLVVSDPGLMAPVTDSMGGPIINRWILLRSSLRDQLMDAVGRIAGTDGGNHPGGGLIRSLLVGDRRDLDDAIRRDFTRTGLAHLLAISGLHLAVLAAIPWFGLKWIGIGRRIRCLVVVILLAGYGWILDSTASIDRATLMGVAVFLGMAMGIRFRTIPLLASAATVLLWVNPGLVEQTGFQLSFVATAGLVISMNPARTRWFGSPDAIGMTRRAIIRNRWTAALSAAIVAWLATMPIVESRFGVVAIVAVPATLTVAPAVVVILVVGFPLLVLAHAAPATAEILASPLRWFSAELSSQLATLASVMPVLTTADFGPAWTTIATVLAVIVPGLEAPRWCRIGGGLLLTGMLVLPLAPGLHGEFPGKLRIDQLAVGDGTSILLRTRNGSVLFDAGSASIDRVGGRVIVPALRALGVRHLDAIVISHPNLDHFDGAVEVADRIPTDRVVVSEEFGRIARSRPQSLVRAHLDGLRRAGLVVEEVSRGSRRTFGGAEWLFLHPAAGEESRTVNDGSIVALVTPKSTERSTRWKREAMERPGEPLVCAGHAEKASNCGVLLFGDVQNEGVAKILQREPELRAAVMELPHHGSWRPIVERLIERIDPRIVLQSTGRRRFESDRFGPACDGRIRLVTARDGAATIELDGRGSASIRTGRTGLAADVFLLRGSFGHLPGPVKDEQEVPTPSGSSHRQMPSP